MAGFNVRVDGAGVKAIEAALKELPLELKGKAISQAQIKAAAVLRNEAKTLGQQLGGSGSWSKAQQVVSGNEKKYKPYVVLKTSKKRFNIQPKSSYLDSPKATTAAPIKYNHLLQKGSAPQVRTGGQGKSTRGGAIGTRGTGRGGFMVRNAQTGYIHRIKQIKHPGFQGHDIYGKVLASRGEEAIQRFNQDAIQVIDKFKKKKGFA
jgi:hypothetical protein